MCLRLSRRHGAVCKMSIRFDLTDLRLFLHVAEAASITHGAMRANMALSARE